MKVFNTINILVTDKLVRTIENDIAPAGGEGNIYLKVRTMTRGQSVYSDIDPYISIYCVYWIEDTTYK